MLPRIPYVVLKVCASASYYVKWPFFRKCKLLLPFGWIYFGARHIFRVITGKRRRINVSGMVRGAGERRELYARLGLYEDGDE